MTEFKSCRACCIEPLLDLLDGKFKIFCWATLDKETGILKLGKQDW